jgi:hypothetical protein
MGQKSCFKSFSFWKPGGKTGKVKAPTTFDAAAKVLNVDKPLFCGGDIFSGMVYTSGQTECKLWQK